MNAVMVLAALLTLDQTPQPLDSISVFNAQMAPYQQAFARHGDQVYEIARTEERGFRVRRVNDEAALGIVLFPEMGKVVGIVAMSKKASAKWTMLVLGLAILSDDGLQVEYRMCNTGRVTPEPKDWACSEVLLRRPVADAYNMMSIAIPTGDSTAMMLSRLTRGDDTDTIESHVILDHCPPNAGGITNQFSTANHSSCRFK